MRVTWLYTLIIWLPACTLQPVPALLPKRHYNFNYALEKQRKTGLIQVFDDGFITYLKFAPSIEVKQLRVFESSDRSVPVSCYSPQYCVLEKVPDAFEVRIQDARTFVRKNLDINLYKGKDR